MEDTNKEKLVEKLTNIADGFRTSRSLTETLSLDDMATLAAVPITSGENKLAAFVDGTLTEITAQDLQGITEIRKYAFYYAPITTIELPNTITKLGESAFDHCNKLVDIVLHDNITSVGDYLCRYCDNLETAIIGNGIDKIKRGMFFNCQKLRTITWGNITEIGYASFQYCEVLENVILPETLRRIDYSGFNGCRSFTEITIPNSTTTIVEWAFSGCSNLTNMVIGTGIVSIGNGSLAIGSSTNKATITFLGTTPPTIHSNAFNSGWLNKIIVPAGSGEAYRTATNWANYADFIEEASV